MRTCVLLLIALAGISLTARAELKDVYALSDSYKLSRDGAKIFSVESIDLATLRKKSLLWNAEAKTVSLVGARGETLAFQIVLEPDAQGAGPIDVTVSDLTGADTIKSGSVELFKEWYVEAKNISNENNQPSTGLGWYPDALVPWSVKDHGKYKGVPFSIETGQVQAVWIDLHIPAEVKGGGYKGTIDVLVDGKSARKLSIDLRVHHFALPKEPHNLFFMNGDISDILEAGGEWLTNGKREKKMEGALLKYENECYRVARAHRFVFGNMYYSGYRDQSSVLPKIETGAGGEITNVDWSAYDARFGRLLDPKNNIFGPGEAPIELWRLPMSTQMTAGNEWEKKKAQKFPRDDRAWEQFPQWIKKHWDEKGWDLNRAYVYLADEPLQKDLPALEEFTKKINAATTPPLHTQIAILSNAKNFQTFIPEFQKRFVGQLDRWLWSANSINPGPLQEKLRESDWLGFYQGNEPYVSPDVLDKDGLAMRTWSWIAWLYKMKYMCNYSCTEFASIGDSAKNSSVWEKSKTRETGNLLKAMYIYPGDYVGCDFPIVSLRMKQVRRGQQDYEYMWLLSQQGKRGEVDAGVRKIVVKALGEASEKPNQNGHKAAWDRNPENWDGLIREFGDRLDKAE
jgi:hypothetical protein